MIQVVGRTSPSGFSEGMIISKVPNPKNRRDVETVKGFTGSCAKGLHFGTGCYDRISQWWEFEKVPDPKPKPLTENQKRIIGLVASFLRA